MKLHEKWVAFLANAGSPTEANKVPPSYVDTLRQLTPKQAEMLDWMYGQKVPPDVLGSHSRWPNFLRADLERAPDRYPTLNRSRAFAAPRLCETFSK